MRTLGEIGLTISTSTRATVRATGGSIKAFRERREASNFLEGSLQLDAALAYVGEGCRGPREDNSFSREVVLTEDVEVLPAEILDLEVDLGAAEHVTDAPFQDGGDSLEVRSPVDHRI